MFEPVFKFLKDVLSPLLAIKTKLGLGCYQQQAILFIEKYDTQL